MTSGNSNGKFDYLKFTRELASKYGHEHSDFVKVISEAENFRKSSTKRINLIDCCYNVSRKGFGPLDTPYGSFYQMTFKLNDKWQSYNVIVKSGIDNKLQSIMFDKDRDVFLRIDSGCCTGQLFHDRTCECREQLEVSLKKLGENYQGLIIHIPTQDGRGKGVDFKLATLFLQNQLRINTVEAFTLLEKNNRDSDLDCRDYNGAVAILKYLGVNNRLIFVTNNPRKLEALAKNGFDVISEPIVIPPTPLTANHLEAKKAVLGHNYEGLK